MISNVHLSPNTSSERAPGQLDRPCLICVGMADMLAHATGATTTSAAALNSRKPPTSQRAERRRSTDLSMLVAVRSFGRRRCSHREDHCARLFG